MVKGLALASVITLGLCHTAPPPTETLFPPEWESVRVAVQDVPIKATLRVSERVEMREGYHTGMYFKAILDANGDQIRVIITGCYNADGSTISVGDGGPVFVFTWEPFMGGYGLRLPLNNDGFLTTFTLFTFLEDERGPYAVWREGVVKFTNDGGVVWEISDEHPYIEFEVRPFGDIYGQDEETLEG
jgi:hypothetical protein